MATFDSYRIHHKIGLELNLKNFPRYFVELSNKANKQLCEDDIKSIIKSRCICEDKIEKAYDDFTTSIYQQTRTVRTQTVIKLFYS